MYFEMESFYVHLAGLNPSDWPLTHGDPPARASWVLELKAWVNTPGHSYWIS